MTPWLSVIGIGEDGMAGLADAARRLIAEADFLVGGARHLALVPDSASRAERRLWGQPFSAGLDEIMAFRGRPVAVLASGDPMEFGVGASLARRVAPEEMIVLPQPGAFSLAASRMRWPLQDVRRLSLHGRPLEPLGLHLAPGARLLVLTADGATPLAVARWLAARGWGASDITVLEQLGGPDEARFTARAADFPERRFADLNTLAITCRHDPGARVLPRLAGLPDRAFHHDGQLTKSTVRAVTLALLAPLPGELLWDVGAGCGSIAIEWLRAAEGSRAIAIERDPSRCRLIALNAAALGVPDLRIVEGSAPEDLPGLPDPDAIFIGGGLEGALVERCWEALKPGGRLVSNAVTVEGEAVLFAVHAVYGGQLSRIAESHAQALGSHYIWRPAIPVTQFVARKPGGDGRSA